MSYSVRAAKLAIVALTLAVLPSLAVAQHLDYHGGRVIHHPRLHVVYFSGNWDADNPPEFSRANIESWLTSWVGSDYFDVAGQYDVHSGTFQGGHESILGSAGSSTNSLAIHLWLTGEIEVPGTGVPYNCDSDDLYVVMLPQGTTIDNGFNKTCGSFGAYHFFVPIYIPPFVCGFDPLGDLNTNPYAIIPVQCATHAAGANGFYTDFDGLTMLLSHEILESMTDPMDSFITGIPVIGDIFSFIGGILSDLGLGNPNPAWYDGSLSLGDLFTKSEACDIPEFNPVGNVDPEVWEGNSLVAAYWSNNDNDRAAGPGVVRNFTLKQSGIPSGPVVPVTLDGRNLDVNKGGGFTIQVATNTSHTYSFPSPVAGGAGVQYVTTDPAATATVGVADTFSKTVAYDTQYYLTVSTSPAAAATGNATLTASGFYNAGLTNLSADQDVAAGAGQRYDFLAWGGDVSSGVPNFAFNLTAPTSAVADYALQDYITFGETGIPAAVPWTVTVNSTPHAGPYSDWFNDGSNVAYSYQSPVPDLSVGTQYVLTGSSPASPFTASGPTTVTGTYKTQYLLTINTSGLGANTTHLFNSGTLIGTASDPSPFSGWFDSGTVLALSADALVDGAGGIEYFFQNFAPAPPGTLTAAFTTTANYETMDQLINDALASGGIYGPSANGLSNALHQKWAAVTASLAAQKYQPALGQTKAFIALLQAQSGKEITPALATTLELDVLMVYHSALCKGVAAGQISAVPAANDYSYYSGLVTSLGGTPLPPC